MEMQIYIYKSFHFDGTFSKKFTFDLRAFSRASLTVRSPFTKRSRLPFIRRSPFAHRAFNLCSQIVHSKFISHCHSELQSEKIVLRKKRRYENSCMHAMKSNWINSARSSEAGVTIVKTKNLNLLRIVPMSYNIKACLQNTLNAHVSGNSLHDWRGTLFCFYLHNALFTLSSAIQMNVKWIKFSSMSKIPACC